MLRLRLLKGVARTEFPDGARRQEERGGLVQRVLTIHVEGAKRTAYSAHARSVGRHYGKRRTHKKEKTSSCWSRAISERAISNTFSKQAKQKTTMATWPVFHRMLHQVLVRGGQVEELGNHFSPMFEQWSAQCPLMHLLRDMFCCP